MRVAKSQQLAGLADANSATTLPAVEHSRGRIQAARTDRERSVLIAACQQVKMTVAEATNGSATIFQAVQLAQQAAPTLRTAAGDGGTDGTGFYSFSSNKATSALSAPKPLPGPEREVLPIDEHRDEIVRTIRERRVTCIQGETGCGKSSRVPQYVYHLCRTPPKRPGDAERIVVCTQPRRLAAVTLAQRVSKEMGESTVGGLVGYRISGESAIDSRRTRLLFVTTGYLLQVLVNDPGQIHRYSHIILDEAHERTVDADLVSLVLKLQIQHKLADFKIVIMSATLQGSIFSRYFQEEGDRSSPPPPIFVGVKRYHLDILYLDDLPAMKASLGQQELAATTIEELRQRTGLSLSGASLEALNAGLEGFRNAMNIPLQRRANVAQAMMMNPMAAQMGMLQETAENEFWRMNSNSEDGSGQSSSGSSAIMKPQLQKNFQHVILELVRTVGCGGEGVLIFLPGIGEISELFDVLEILEQPVSEQTAAGWNPQARRSPCEYKIFVLHSTIPMDEQEQAFREPPENVCHVFLASNIAESSVTLPKVRVVIDTCLHRTMAHDKTKHGLNCLQTQWISHASASQRTGRTGRVFPGVSIRLVPRNYYSQHMPQYDPPEIEQAPLEKLYLNVKQLSQRIRERMPRVGALPPRRLLQLTVQPPPMERLEEAVCTLAELGALTTRSDETACITVLGRMAIALPLDLRLCRLVLFGVLFGCAADAVVMAAALSGQDPFTLPISMVIKDHFKYSRAVMRSFESRKHFDGGALSEPIMLRNLFKTWLDGLKSEGAGNDGKPRLAQSGSAQRHTFVKHAQEFAKIHAVMPKRLTQLALAVVDVAQRTMEFLAPNSGADTAEAAVASPSRVRLESLLAKLGVAATATDPKKKKDSTAAAAETKPMQVTLALGDLFCEDLLLLKTTITAAFAPLFAHGIPRCMDYSSAIAGPMTASTRVSSLEDEDQDGASPEGPKLVMVKADSALAKVHTQMLNKSDVFTDPKACFCIPQVAEAVVQQPDAYSFSMRDFTSHGGAKFKKLLIVQGQAFFNFEGSAADEGEGEESEEEEIRMPESLVKEVQERMQLPSADDFNVSDDEEERKRAASSDSESGRRGSRRKDKESSDSSMSSRKRKQRKLSKKKDEGESDDEETKASEGDGKSDGDGSGSPAAKEKEKSEWQWSTAGKRDDSDDEASKQDSDDEKKEKEREKEKEKEKKQREKEKEKEKKKEKEREKEKEKAKKEKGKKSKAKKKKSEDSSSESSSDSSKSRKKKKKKKEARRKKKKSRSRGKKKERAASECLEIESSSSGDLEIVAEKPGKMLALPSAPEKEEPTMETAFEELTDEQREKQRRRLERFRAMQEKLLTEGGEAAAGDSKMELKGAADGGSVLAKLKARAEKSEKAAEEESADEDNSSSSEEEDEEASGDKATAAKDSEKDAVAPASDDKEDEFAAFLNDIKENDANAQETEEKAKEAETSKKAEAKEAETTKEAEDEGEVVEVEPKKTSKKKKGKKDAEDKAAKKDAEEKVASDKEAEEKEEKKKEKTKSKSKKAKKEAAPEEKDEKEAAEEKDKEKPCSEAAEETEKKAAEDVKKAKKKEKKSKKKEGDKEKPEEEPSKQEAEPVEVEESDKVKERGKKRTKKDAKEEAEKPKEEEEAEEAMSPADEEEVVWKRRVVAKAPKAGDKKRGVQFGSAGAVPPAKKAKADKEAEDAEKEGASGSDVELFQDIKKAKEEKAKAAQAKKEEPEDDFANFLDEIKELDALVGEGEQEEVEGLLFKKEGEEEAPQSEAEKSEGKEEKVDVKQEVKEEEDAKMKEEKEEDIKEEKVKEEVKEEAEDVEIKEESGDEDAVVKEEPKDEKEESEEETKEEATKKGSAEEKDDKKAAEKKDGEDEEEDEFAAFLNDIKENDASAKEAEEKPKEDEADKDTENDDVAKEKEEAKKSADETETAAEAEPAKQAEKTDSAEGEVAESKPEKKEEAEKKDDDEDDFAAFLDGIKEVEDEASKKAAEEKAAETAEAEADEKNEPEKLGKDELEKKKLEALKEAALKEADKAPKEDEAKDKKMADEAPATSEGAGVEDNTEDDFAAFLGALDDLDEKKNEAAAEEAQKEAEEEEEDGDGLDDLPVVELKRRLRSAGVALPSGPEDKDELVALLREATTGVKRPAPDAFMDFLSEIDKIGPGGEGGEGKKEDHSAFEDFLKEIDQMPGEAGQAEKKAKRPLTIHWDAARKAWVVDVGEGFEQEVFSSDASPIEARRQALDFCLQKLKELESGEVEKIESEEAKAAMQKRIEQAKAVLTEAKVPSQRGKKTPICTGLDFSCMHLLLQYASGKNTFQWPFKRQQQQQNWQARHAQGYGDADQKIDLHRPLHPFQLSWRVSLDRGDGPGSFGIGNFRNPTGLVVSCPTKAAMARLQKEQAQQTMDAALMQQKLREEHQQRLASMVAGASSEEEIFMVNQRMAAETSASTLAAQETARTKSQNVSSRFSRKLERLAVFSGAQGREDTQSPLQLEGLTVLPNEDGSNALPVLLLLAFFRPSTCGGNSKGGCSALCDLDSLKVRAVSLFGQSEESRWVLPITGNKKLSLLDLEHVNALRSAVSAAFEVVEEDNSKDDGKEKEKESKEKDKDKGKDKDAALEKPGGTSGSGEGRVYIRENPDTTRALGLLLGAVGQGRSPFDDAPDEDMGETASTPAIEEAAVPQEETESKETPVAKEAASDVNSASAPAPAAETPDAGKADADPKSEGDKANNDADKTADMEVDKEADKDASKDTEKEEDNKASDENVRQLGDVWIDVDEDGVAPSSDRNFVRWDAPLSEGSSGPSSGSGAAGFLSFDDLGKDKAEKATSSALPAALPQEASTALAAGETARRFSFLPEIALGKALTERAETFRAMQAEARDLIARGKPDIKAAHDRVRKLKKTAKEVDGFMNKARNAWNLAMRAEDANGVKQAMDAATTLMQELSVVMTEVEVATGFVEELHQQAERNEQRAAAWNKSAPHIWATAARAAKIILEKLSVQRGFATAICRNAEVSKRAAFRKADETVRLVNEKMLRWKEEEEILRQEAREDELQRQANLRHPFDAVTQAQRMTQMEVARQQAEQQRQAQEMERQRRQAIQWGRHLVQPIPQMQYLPPKRMGEEAPLPPDERGQWSGPAGAGSGAGDASPPAAGNWTAAPPPAAP
eukprot:TRINITY_DN1520_c1_g1_i2.p1 TRINITY_DN1520_c1_g1~~TRINITY_DN1520_c1_g1_i2.p1  ORF type:complete len:3371 (-),score=1236.43 TRINITY_DN1520_c1_g1_i2:41-9523(-)